MIVWPIKSLRCYFHRWHGTLNCAVRSSNYSHCWRNRRPAIHRACHAFRSWCYSVYGMPPNIVHSRRWIGWPYKRRVTKSHMRGFYNRLKAGSSNFCWPTIIQKFEMVNIHPITKLELLNHGDFNRFVFCSCRVLIGIISTITIVPYKLSSRFIETTTDGTQRSHWRSTTDPTYNIRPTVAFIATSTGIHRYSRPRT